MADSRQKDYGPAYRHDGLAHHAPVGLFIVDDWKSRRYELRNYALALVFPVMIVAKILVAKVLPAKYFYDNNRVLGMTLSDGFADAWGGSYQVAADIFKAINVFHFDTMLQWSIVLGIVFSSVVFLMVMRLGVVDDLQFLFLLACVGLLNIYVFTIGKDMIQFVFFMMIYSVLAMGRLPQWGKVSGCLVVLLTDAMFFKTYYVLIAALFLAVTALLTPLRSQAKTAKKSRVFGIVVTLYALVFLLLFVAQYVSPEDVQSAINVRNASTEGREGNADSVTVILNLIPGSGLGIFMANYAINAVRMMIPLELLVKGVSYLPFFAFQMLLAFYLLRLLSRINLITDDSQFIALCLFLGYALASFIFEPDFGSWVRHEISTFPVMCLIVFSSNQRLRGRGLE